MPEEKEIWKQYPDYDFIEVSNLGRVRTKDRIVTDRRGRKLHIKGRVLKQRLNKNNGYMWVCFKVKGKQVTLSVHRMVAITHTPNPNNLPEVNHIDCDRTNNMMDNLEWCTRQENIAYRDKLGHCVNNNPGRPTFAINIETSEVFRFESQHETSRLLEVSQGYVSNVIKDKYNKTKKWWFCYGDDTAVEKTREKFGDKIALKVEELIRQNQN